MAPNPYMTAGEAILWIATRDADYAAKYANESGISLGVALNARPHFGYAPKVRSERNARQALEAKCLNERIVVTGWRGTRTEKRGVRREQVPAMAWSDGHLREEGDAMVLAPNTGGECWHDLLFRRVDVVRTFWPLGPEVPQSSKATEVPQAAQPAPEPSPIPLKAEAGRKPESSQPRHVDVITALAQHRTRLRPHIPTWPEEDAFLVSKFGDTLKDRREVLRSYRRRPEVISKPGPRPKKGPQG